MGTSATTGLYLALFMDLQVCFIELYDYFCVSTTQFSVLYFDNMFYHQIKLVLSSLLFWKILSLFTLNLTVILGPYVGGSNSSLAHMFFPGPCPEFDSLCSPGTLRRWFTEMRAHFIHPPLARPSLKASTIVLPSPRGIHPPLALKYFSCSSSQNKF